MGKNKKIYKIPLYSLLAILILAGISFFSLKSPAVQTWLFEKFAAAFSENNDIELSADNIRFTFFNKIEVSGLLIKDNTADTMLYSPQVKAGIRSVKRKKRLISLGRLDIDSPVIKLRPDTSDILNLQYFLGLMSAGDTAKSNRDLSIRQINITNGKLSYKSGTKAVSRDNFDINNIGLYDLNLCIDDLDKHYSNIDLIISELSFSTDKGFVVDNLFSEVHIKEGEYRLIDPTIRTANSFINSDIIGINIRNKGDNFKFSRDASLKFKLQSSLISLSELSHFIDRLEGFDRDIIFSGDISGTVGEMNGRDIVLSYSDSTMLRCDFDLSGLPDIDNTFMFIDVENLTTTANEIADLQLPGIENIDFGNEFQRLGAISFSGNFTGFIKDFVTYGTLYTELGSVSSDILFRPDTSSTFYYKGTLEAQAVQLGSILDNENLLGLLSARFDVEGTSVSFKNFRARMDATIESLEFNGYRYRDLEINGLVTEKIWDGSVSSNTSDLKMDLLARLDLRGEEFEVDFSLNLLEADLYRLNINPTDSISKLSMLVTANFTGNNIDNISGDIRLLNAKLRKENDEFDLYNCSISAFNTDSAGMGLKLRTDYVDADLEGRYEPGNIISDMQIAVSELFPSFISAPAKELSGNNDFDYELRFKNTDRINEFFETGLILSPGFILKGHLAPGKNMSLSASGEYIVYNTNSLSEPDLSCIIRDSSMILQFYSEELNLINSLSLEQFEIQSDAAIDSFIIDVGWENRGELRNTGALQAKAAFSKPDSLHTRLEADIMAAKIYINDKPWEVDPSRLIIDSTAIGFKKLLVSRENKFLMIDGKVSEDPSDSINIHFNKLNLSGLNNIERAKSPDEEKNIEFILGGLLNGEILITGIYDNPMFETDIVVKDFNTNGHEHGDVKLLSEWDKQERLIGLSLRNNNDGKNTFSIEGDYDPLISRMELIAELQGMPLDILNIFLKSFASELDGSGTGSVKIISDKGIMSLYGSVLAEEASMTVDYLQSNFRFSDSIRFDNDKLVFSNIPLRDNKDNNAVLDGFVSHSNFKQWFVDLRINAEDILVFDTRPKDNSLFYGTAYATGLVTIEGPATNLDFNISAQTGNNTRMFIPLNSDEEVSSYTFISFKGTGQETDSIVPLRLPAFREEGQSSISLDIELQATPDAEVELLFDSKLGDALKARGAGTLNMALDNEGDFTIFGDYVIEDGDYQLTLGNIFNKRFIVENGGTISWNGDIRDASIDIKAIYKLKASLDNLLQDPDYAERIPVECHLNIGGKLENPVIGFDIYLPTADETTRTYLKDAIDSDEEMSRQFLYLLVMNSFYPAAPGSTINTTNAGASAMGVTTTEMLSNQLSNWLSQISNDFDIGFTYRPGNEISSQEVEVALSTQLLNDRVIINGNLDVGGEETSSSTNEISGDFNVEVKITEKVRFKVFNRSNDNLKEMYERAPYTQGFGFFFRQSFDRIGDLFKRKSTARKPEEETGIVDQ